MRIKAKQYYCKTCTAETYTVESETFTRSECNSCTINRLSRTVAELSERIDGLARVRQEQDARLSKRIGKLEGRAAGKVQDFKVNPVVFLGGDLMHPDSKHEKATVKVECGPGRMKKAVSYYAPESITVRFNAEPGSKQSIRTSLDSFFKRTPAECKLDAEAKRRRTNAAYKGEMNARLKEEAHKAAQPKPFDCIRKNFIGVDKDNKPLFRGDYAVASYGIQGHKLAGDGSRAFYAKCTYAGAAKESHGFCDARRADFCGIDRDGAPLFVGDEVSDVRRIWKFTITGSNFRVCPHLVFCK